MKKSVVLILGMLFTVLSGCGSHTHSYKIVDSKEATCLEDGYKVLKCDCGDSKKDVIKATGHNYEDGKCVHCNETIEQRFHISSKLNYFVGETSQIKIEESLVLDSKNPKLTYHSDNDVVSVSETGLITANKIGSAKVWSTSENGGKTPELLVDVVEDSNSVVSIDVTDSAYVRVLGRTKVSEEGIELKNTSSGFEVMFVGSTLNCSLTSTYETLKVRVYIDGEKEGHILTASNSLILADNLSNELHTVKVLKVNSEIKGSITITNISGPSKFYKVPQKDNLKFEFMGDSLTCGYGVNADGSGDTIPNEDGTRAYAQLLTDYYGADSSTLCVSGISFAVPNWIETTADKKWKNYSISADEDAWDFNKYQPDYLFFMYGTNDDGGIGRGKGSYQDYKFALLNFLYEATGYYPNTTFIVIYGMTTQSQGIKDASMEAVEEATSEGVKVHYFSMQTVKDRGGADSHPGLAGQRDGFEQILSLTKGIIK